MDESSMHRHSGVSPFDASIAPAKTGRLAGKN